MTTWFFSVPAATGRRGRPPLLDVLKALGEHVRHRPDATALVEDERTLTYRELCGFAGGLGRRVAGLRQVIGIFAPNCIEWIIADLALSHAGKTVVPLPVFFSSQQLAHIIKDAKVGYILTIPPLVKTVSAMGVPYGLIDLESAPLDVEAAQPSGCIIYTSGATGQPKGVRLG